MQSSSRQGWVVTGAATGINLALGILYAWSVLKGGIPDSWGWSNASKALPYSVACLVFSLCMIPAGRLQDRLGPRGVATLGGILTGVGCIVASLSGSSLADPTPSTSCSGTMPTRSIDSIDRWVAAS